MRQLSYTFTFLIFLFNVVFVTGQTGILIDDTYEDWDDIGTQNDNTGEVNGLDILKASVTDSEDYIYFYLKIDREIKIYDDQYGNDEIKLYIDTDNDASTGKPFNGIGAEIEIDFVEREYFHHYPAISNWSRWLSDLDFEIAPTTTSDEFEIRLIKNAEANGNPIFVSPKMSYLFSSKTGDYGPDEIEVYEWNNYDWTYTPVDISSQVNNTIRVMSHNTLNEGLELSELYPSYERIYSKVRPEVVIFNESDVSTSLVEDLMNQWVPSENAWTAVKRNSRTVIASSFPIIDSEYVSYRITGVKIDLPDDEYNTDLLVIGMHAPCCENDADRQVEADRFARYVLDLKSNQTEINVEEGTPIVAGGDLNLVGYKQQLTTFLTGDIQYTSTFGDGGPLDWDNTSLAQVVALESDRPLYHTWDGSNSSWPNSKLDYILYSDSQVKAKKSFVINTDGMSNERLNVYNFQYYDTDVMSDHYPIVADLELQSNINVATVEPTRINIEMNINNPFSDYLSIDLEGTEETLNLRLLSRDGKLVKQTTIPSGTQFVQIETHDLASGVYWLHLQTVQQSIALKLVKI